MWLETINDTILCSFSYYFKLNISVLSGIWDLSFDKSETTMKSMGDMHFNGLLFLLKEL